MIGRGQRFFEHAGSTDGEQENPTGADDAPQFGKPCVLVLRVQMREHAVPEDQVETAVLKMQRRQSLVPDRRGFNGRIMFTNPRDGRIVTVRAGQMRIRQPAPGATEAHGRPRNQSRARSEIHQGFGRSTRAPPCRCHR